jgi:hypothetical protein
MGSYDNRERFNRVQEKFFENLKDQKRWADYVRTKHELGTAGPNSLKNKISRGNIARSKKVPISLPKMSWEK